MFDDDMNDTVVCVQYSNIAWQEWKKILPSSSLARAAVKFHP